LVLVVLVALGLVSLGIKKVREAATRTQCTNNLRQIGLALQNYQETYKRFPSGTMSPRDLPAEKRLSWLLAIHAFLESSPLYKETDKAKAWDSPENHHSAHATVGCYLCPANPVLSAPRGESLTHYVGIAGVGKDAAVLPRGHARDGLFKYQPDKIVAEPPDSTWGLGIRPKDIKDDPATTLAVIETNHDNGPWLAGGRPTVRGLDAQGLPYLGQDAQFGSYHRHGSHAVFADASVRFLPDSLDAQVLEAMATIAGGEKIRPFDEE
jgi:hypothetical protein